LWSYGDVRLAHGVKLHRVGFHKGPVVCVIQDPNRDPREPLRLEVNLGRSCADLGPRVGGLAINISVYEGIKTFKIKNQTYEQ
jgi:hypothetical protein